MIEGKQWQKDQEQQALPKMRLKEPKSNQMEMSHMMVGLETMTVESRQHALELEIMRRKYEAGTKRVEDLMKRVENLSKENVLLKKELKRREVKETL